MRNQDLITTDNSVQCDGRGWVRLSDPGIAPGDPAISASIAAQVPGPGLRSVGGGTGKRIPVPTPSVYAETILGHR